MLDRDGKALVALNAAMYAADKSDRIAALRVRMRDERATADHLELCGDEVDRRGAHADAGGRRAGRQRRRRHDGRHAGPRVRHLAHLDQRPAADRVDSAKRPAG